MLKDVVVSAIMSDHKLGPKLYGIFPAGRIEEFIEVRFCVKATDCWYYFCLDF